MGGLERAIEKAKHYMTKKAMKQHYATEQSITRLEHYKTHLWKHSKTKQNSIKAGIITSIAAGIAIAGYASFYSSAPYDVVPKLGHWFTKNILQWELPPIPERGEAPAYLAATTYFANGKEFNEKNRLKTTLHIGEKPEVGNYKFISYEELEQVKPIFIKGVIAVEDKEFFNHKGTSPRDVISAIIDNRHSGEIRGASSITNQLAKHMANNVTGKRTLKQKCKENFLISFELEEKYDKKDLLELYLNTMYFGNGSYGIQAAATNYFNKEVKDLDANEVAYIIGMLKEPALATKDTDKDEKRAKTILKIMWEENVIKDMEYSTNLIKTFEFKEKHNKQIAPYTTITAQKELLTHIKKENGRFLNVKTSIDLDAQRILEEELRKMNKDFKKNDHLERQYFGIIVNNNAQIIAKVGSKDYFTYFNDYSTMPLRSGSLLKTLMTTWVLEKYPDIDPDEKILVGKKDWRWSNDDPELTNMRHSRYKQVRNHHPKYDNKTFSINDMIKYSLNEEAIFLLKHAKKNVDQDPSDEVTDQDRVDLMNEMYDFWDNNLGVRSFLIRHHKKMKEGILPGDENTDMYLNAILTQMNGVSYTEVLAGYVSAITGRQQEPSIIKEIWVAGEEKPLYIFTPSNKRSVSDETAKKMRKAVQGVLNGTAYQFRETLNDSLRNIYNFGAKTGTSNLGAGFIGICTGYKWNTNEETNNNEIVSLIIYDGYTDYENINEGNTNHIGGSNISPYAAEIFNKILKVKTLEEVNQ